MYTDTYCCIMQHDKQRTIWSTKNYPETLSKPQGPSATLRDPQRPSGSSSDPEGPSGLTRDSRIFLETH